MNIEIYTKPSCPYCINAKKLISSKNLEYTEYTVGKDGITKQTIIDRLNGGTISTVPQIFIDGNHIGGYTELVKYWKDS